MTIPSFSPIQARAERRKGGAKGLAAWLSTPIKPVQSDAACLAEMTRCVFQAGFVWRVIDNKWSGFEAAFWNFDPDKLVLMSPEQQEALAADTRIVRNWTKIQSVFKNAQFVRELAHEYGSVAAMLAAWPLQNQVGLWDVLKKRGDRLGGLTGMRVLRNLGYDAFVLSNDVLLCLKDAGLTVNKGTGKAEQKLIQAAFNQWHAESGLPYAHLSRICACSIGENHTLVSL